MLARYMLSSCVSLSVCPSQAYAKAFDDIDHNTVIQKLKFLGVPDFIVRWKTSFLCERQQRVKISNIFSEWIWPREGMSQGSWVWPHTFIFLNDDLDDTTLQYLK